MSPAQGSSDTSFLPLPREFYQQPTLVVARQLIGLYLVRDTAGVSLAGRIVETEAYRQDEAASHSFRGETERTRPMFKAGGVGYIYFIYGMYNCFNVVSESAGIGCAVLIRAIEPIQGTATMWTNRFPDKPFDSDKAFLIANGPGKLCLAMNITRDDSGGSLIDGGIRICEGTPVPDSMVEQGPRIGLSKAVELPWRFYEIGNPSLSR